MMMKKLIIFDLDGTLLDTSEGIMYCYRSTGEALNLKKNEVDNAKCVIGGPLRDGFERLYEIESDETLCRAIETYRKLYKSDGIKKFKPYDGIKEMLSTLKDNGCLLAVATLKLESYAKQMLESAGLSEYFDIICGWDGTDGCTKAVILTKVMCELKTMKSNAILVGDSVYDAKGADVAGIDFLGVTYGFGIKEDDNLSIKYPIASSPKEISEYIIK